MRRLMCIAGFFVFLAVPLWAQRGGHASSASHSFAGHSSGFASHGFSGGHMAGGHFSSGRAAFHGSAAFNRFRGPVITNGFRNNFGRHGFRNCFGLRCGAGFFNPWWSYDPWLWADWSDMDARFDADYDNNLALANQMDEQSVNQQNLERERMFRQEQRDGDQDSYTSRPSVPPVRTGEPSAAPLPATVLVFRDEHKEEVQNYAIVGETLWNFASGRTQKIPLSRLDLTATEKANDDRGVSFRVPGSLPGQ